MIPKEETLLLSEAMELLIAAKPETKARIYHRMAAYAKKNWEKEYVDQTSQRTKFRMRVMHRAIADEIVRGAALPRMTRDFPAQIEDWLRKLRTGSGLEEDE